MANLAPTWRPKRLPNRGQKPKKSKLKNKSFLASIFKGSRPRFGRVFGRFFGPKMHGNSKNTILAKTLKIVLPSRRNWYFQGFEAWSFERCFRKCAQKSCVFWSLHLEGFWGGFWESFGRPKPSIFAFFRHFFEANFKAFFGRLKNRKKERQPEVRHRFWAGPTECARPGGEIERG